MKKILLTMTVAAAALIVGCAPSSDSKPNAKYKALSQSFVGLWVFDFGLSEIIADTKFKPESANTSYYVVSINSKHELGYITYGLTEDDKVFEQNEIFGKLIRISENEAYLSYDAEKFKRVSQENGKPWDAELWAEIQRNPPVYKISDGKLTVAHSYKEKTHEFKMARITSQKLEEMRAEAKTAMPYLQKNAPLLKKSLANKKYELVEIVEKTTHSDGKETVSSKKSADMQEEYRYETGDDYLWLTAKRLSFSPDGKTLKVNDKYEMLLEIEVEKNLTGLNVSFDSQGSLKTESGEDLHDVTHGLIKLDEEGFTLTKSLQSDRYESETIYMYKRVQ